MSNHLAIATVTATLQRTLQASVQNHVEGARVTTVSPSEVSRGTPETGVNIFMYQVISNPALHNIDATPLRTKGTAVKRQAALDLYYMLSFYGNNNELTPQRLLGSVVRTLNDKRVITQAMIREACNDTTFSFLRDSNLADQVQQVSILPLDLNLDDLSKTWSVFFQTPYVLSLAYKSLVVLVEGDEVMARSLPVRERRSGGFSPYFARPKVESVTARAGKTALILADSTLLIRGTQLKGEQGTTVQIGKVAIAPETITPTEIILSLSTLPFEALRAGVQSLQVIHQPPAIATADRSPSLPPSRQGATSEAAPFILRPQVLDVSVTDLEETDEGLYDATVAVQVNLIVGSQQQIVLSLNEWNADPSADYLPTNYMFDLPRRTAESQTLSIPIQSVKAGEYLIRLLVDGAESQLEVDTDEASPTYEWYVGPRIVIESD
ncbi:DUF4255 domain-containing protein [cf. Phormidesmis sp. LEGE 11477]|uniref:DUF4255 domain-containing protein n=1 Tax=cf. Phormidesmis sp. LEGE 11477 TaxID=1828680 RepID=UPI00187F59CA|nr:DUF4255 domain-containing protein [cf. Phormidesmis sp. LEGE 11477]MBE9062410.1 DUF4255 domain-containing protein [cf. Phormidesmis sp. LEGE 11477]